MSERGLSYEDIVANTEARGRGGDSDQTIRHSTPRRIRFDREPTPYHRRHGARRRARSGRARGNRRLHME